MANSDRYCMLLLLNIGSIRIFILMTGRNVEQTKIYVCTLKNLF